MNRTPCHTFSAEQITALIGSLLKIEWVWSGMADHLDADGANRVGIIEGVEWSDEPGDSYVVIRSLDGSVTHLYFWGNRYTTLFFTTPEEQ